VTRVRPRALAALLLILPGPLAGQALTTQPQRYLLTTDAFDGRALWVQPAGLVRRREASIGWSVTGVSRDNVIKLDEVGLTFVSSGLGLGWQHALLLDGSSVNQYAVGFGFGDPRRSVGLSRRWMRGARVSDDAWDVGARAVPVLPLELSIALRDIGSPLVRAATSLPTDSDTTYFTTLVPGVALRLFGGRARLGGDWEIVTHDWGTSAVRFGLGVVLPFDLGVNVRAEFSPDFNRRDLALAVTWGGGAVRATGFTSNPEDADARYAGIWASAVRALDQPRRRRGL
jgi:hypothetical protein